MQATTRALFSVELPFSLISSQVISFDSRIDGCEGINPDTRERDIPDDCLPTPDQHLRELVNVGVLSQDNFAFLATARNLMQNLRMPFYTGGQVIQSKYEDAEKSKRPYQGLAFHKDGRITARNVYFSDGFTDDVDSFIAMCPVLRNRRVLEIHDIAPECFDCRHLWSCSGAAFSDVVNAFVEHRHSQHDAASDAICTTAGSLPRETQYLHHAVAVTGSSVIHFAAVGKLEDIGRIAKRLGTASAVTDCFVIENGGSVQMSLLRPGIGRRVLFESWYFREPSIAMLAYGLRTDDPTRVPFSYLSI